MDISGFELTKDYPEAHPAECKGSLCHTLVGGRGITLQAQNQYGGRCVFCIYFTCPDCKAVQPVPIIFRLGRGEATEEFYYGFSKTEKKHGAVEAIPWGDTRVTKFYEKKAR